MRTRIAGFLAWCPQNDGDRGSRRLASFFLSLAFITHLLLMALERTSAAQEARADTPKDASEALQKCLGRADEFPDMAAAESTAWIKRGGSNDAHLCHAFAQANRDMHADSAREFWSLASYYDKKDPHRAIMMHNMSGQEFMAAKDYTNGEIQFSSALKLQANNAVTLVARAKVFMVVERYWDALTDLNQAISLQPNNSEAFRNRAAVWTQLHNSKNAQADAQTADELIAASSPAKSKLE